MIAASVPDKPAGEGLAIGEVIYCLAWGDTQEECRDRCDRLVRLLNEAEGRIP